ncbi:hypothetical protein PC9H_009813 [Pleurotus ostreatus]|uniref:NAD(P)-binding protein n=2 Tax=Pleurotus TaxID=5320 RepID=A0A8H6ZS05_PLEOS|nr:uncharacterized protein PC9H_009813 [Pleurotus ostreatus]KAF7424506.1 hypothetical protein PC9H_009813 [Pleurotus ostreatus]KAG9224935.1 hypothetical protein CCMSSC00406_0001914 [Pleurotus cornucopiae]KAJ8692543.1 hypothetical protein PTI98_009847 [Pleurotus ostreatus]
MSLLVLTAADVAKIVDAIDVEHLESLMSKVFTTISDTSTPVNLSPPRTIIPTERHNVLFMPSRMQQVGTAIKVVSVPTAANSSGLPATTLVMDEMTGAVRAIVNARSLTALRNAAGSVLSTRLVGLKDPATIVAFGAGKQIETHLDLHIRAYPSIRQCTIVNRSNNARLSSLQQYFTSRYPHVRIRCIAREDTADEEIESLVGDASVIICATSSTRPLFPSQWVRDGTHIILIGSYTPRMHEVDTSLVLRACDTSRGGVLLVDSKEACAKEAGELIDAGIGPDAIIEMGEMIGKCEAYPRGPTTFGGVTMFKSVGVGLQDVAIAYATVDKALAMDPPVGTIIGQYDLA